MYQLIVNRLEPLTEEEKERASYRNRGMDGMPSGFSNMKPVKTLEVELTDEEFAAVKRAVTQVM